MAFHYLRVYDEIKNDIVDGKYKVGEKLPTEIELQNEYGVSRITIKKAMDKLSEESYVERFSGKGTFVTEKKKPSVVNTEKKMIGLVMSGFSSRFGQRFIQGVAETTNKLGYSLLTGLYYNSADEEKELIERMIANGAKGIIVMPIHDENLINMGIVEQVVAKFPIVLVDRYLDSMRLPYVGTDNIEGAFTATKYLFSLGHKNIAFVSPIPSTTSIKERETGYMKAYAMTNYKVKQSNIICCLQSGMPGRNTPENFKTDVECIKEFLQSNKDVSAILCADSITMEVCHCAAKELNINVPNELSLVCFDAAEDRIDANQYTYIHQQEIEMGSVAVNMLNDLINGTNEVKTVLLPPKLIIGSSTKEFSK